MLFAHGTEAALAAAAALVNTDDRGTERLPGVEALQAFAGRWGWAWDDGRGEADLRALRALRPRLRRLWLAGPDESAAIVNGLLRESKALPRLEKQEGSGYRMRVTPPDAPLGVRVAVEAAMGFADLIGSGQLDRLRICAHGDCEKVLADLSRNRSRRFCDGGCGNRAAVAAFRARRAKFVGALDVR